MKITAVDPGEWCGVAYWVDGAFGSEETSPYNAVEIVERHMRLIPNLLVVCERYDTASKRPMTQQLEALYTIGALRHVTTRRNATFRLQNRADAKKVTDATLRKLGWYRRTKDGHANDAARHICQALLVHDPVSYLALLDQV